MAVTESLEYERDAPSFLFSFSQLPFLNHYFFLTIHSALYLFFYFSVLYSYFANNSQPTTMDIEKDNVIDEGLYSRQL